MALARVTVVGLGPGDEGFLTTRTRDVLAGATVARLRTAQHPAAAAFAHVPSYDQLYEAAESFEALYLAIVDDLVELAQRSPEHHVVYAVPGSPVVAEHTVELLLARSDVTVTLEPALSVIEVAVSALGRDPMTQQLRIVDALGGTEPLRGPGPLLVLQTYNVEVLASVADRLPPETLVEVLYHLGLPEQEITSLHARELTSFHRADHLTSLWVPELRTAGVAMDDLIALMERLRRECPWDEEQTHASLSRHLLEEAYEVIDALEAYVERDDRGSAVDLEEELGDVLFQIVFHAQLGSEDGRFSFASLADGVREKMIARHPHVFGDVNVATSDDVAEQWEVLKRSEKSRESIVDGIPRQLPALTYYAKLRRKAQAVGIDPLDPGRAMGVALRQLADLVVPLVPVTDATVSTESDDAWGDVLASISDLARVAGVDLESALRRRALVLASDIRSRESEKRGAAEPEE